MITKKDLVIVALATFCLTATIFAVIPTRSQSSNYDPWLDINEDGTINILDLAASAKGFGSSGDPTKNVNVIPQWEEGSCLVNMTWGPGVWGQDVIPTFNTSGFSKMSIFFVPLDSSASGLWIPSNLTVKVRSFTWKIAGEPWYGQMEEFLTNFNITIKQHSQGGWSFDFIPAQIFDVKGPIVSINLAPRWYGFGGFDDRSPPPDYPTGWITLEVRWYLRND